MPTQITREMLVDCYNEFKKGNLEYIQADMNKNSAKMTMLWIG